MSLGYVWGGNSPTNPSSDMLQTSEEPQLFHSRPWISTHKLFLKFVQGNFMWIACTQGDQQSGLFGLNEFLGRQTFSTKIRKVLGKLGSIGHPGCTSSILLLYSIDLSRENSTGRSIHPLAQFSFFTLRFPNQCILDPSTF